jgi:hypothetical protein
LQLQFNVDPESWDECRSDQVMTLIVLAGQNHKPFQRSAQQLEEQQEQQQQGQQEEQQQGQQYAKPDLHKIAPRPTRAATAAGTASPAHLMLAQIPLLLLPEAVVHELEALLEEAVAAWRVTKSFAYQQLLLPVMNDWALLVLGSSSSSSSSNVSSLSSMGNSEVYDSESLNPSSSDGSSSSSSRFGGLSFESQQEIARALAAFFKEYELELCYQQLVRTWAGEGVEVGGEGVGAAGGGITVAGRGVELAGDGTEMAGGGIELAGEGNKHGGVPAETYATPGFVKLRKGRGSSSDGGGSSSTTAADAATHCMTCKSGAGKQQKGWRIGLEARAGSAGAVVGSDMEVVGWKGVLLGFSVPGQEAAYRQWKARQLCQHDLWVMLLFVMALALTLLEAAQLWYSSRSSLGLGSGSLALGFGSADLKGSGSLGLGSGEAEREAALTLLLRPMLLAASIGVQAFSHLLVWLSACHPGFKHLIWWRGWIFTAAQLTILLWPVLASTYSSSAAMKAAMQAMVNGYLASPVLLLGFRHFLHPVLLQAGVVPSALCVLAAVLGHDVAFPLPLAPEVRQVVVLIAVPAHLAVAAYLEHQVRRKFVSTRAWQHHIT